MIKSFSILVQHGPIQHILSRLVGKVAECKWRWFKNWAIRRFIRKYHVDFNAALLGSIDDYPNFNSFFIRKLKPELRPIAQGSKSITSPADGSISQIGHIKGDSIFQAKEFHFSLITLLGDSEARAEAFKNGSFATIYLAPKDYHRVHMPFSGTLKSTVYVPGKLFSVNTYTTEKVPNLFARNERLICFFDTTRGPMAVILVGAMLVGSIHTVWQSPCSSKHLTFFDYKEGPYLERGAELGYFKMGSTVIVLFGKDTMSWSKELNENSVLQMGQLMGETY